MRSRFALALLACVIAFAACQGDDATGTGGGGALEPTGSLTSVTGTGTTVMYALARSGSAGVTAGACGTRLQCFKSAIIEANANTAAGVSAVALAQIDGAAEQDVNMKLTGRQLLIAPLADPNANGKPDFVDAVGKISLGGSTCVTCALMAAQSAFAGAAAESPRVIVLVTDRPNIALPADQTQLSQLTFGANTVIRAFAVGPGVTCTADPFNYGSLNDAAARTEGGSCVNVASFDGLGAVLTDAVNGEVPEPLPDVESPAVTMTSPAAGSATTATPTFAGAAGIASGDETVVTIRLWQGSDVTTAPWLVATAAVSSGKYSLKSPQALVEGAYTAQAEQRDAAGNVGQTEFIAFSVAPPPPPPDETVLRTVAWGLSRSGSAGATGGACGSRLQCFKTAIAEASASTLALVQSAALLMINVAEPDQDVNLKLSGKQLLIAPDADPNANGKPDFVDALDRISLGGGTCFTCALQAAERSFETAQPGSKRVIILVTERVNTYRSTGFTSSGTPTGYPPMELADMTFADPGTVVHAYAVGPDVKCDSDPNGYGSLDEVVALTPGGTCTNVASFDGLGAVIAAAVGR